MVASLMLKLLVKGSSVLLLLVFFIRRGIFIMYIASFIKNDYIDSFSSLKAFK